MMRFGERIHPNCLPYVCAGGGIALGVALFPRLTGGSPLPVLRLLGADRLLPPLWITGLLWLIFTALAGCGAGYALATKGRGGPRELAFWRGMTLLILSVGAALAWYRLVFVSLLLLPAWLCLLGAAVCGLLCVLSWLPTQTMPALAAACLSLWYLVLFLIHFAVMLRN